MERRQTFTCPVSLDDLDSLDSQARQALLRFLQADGIDRVSIVSRGGPDRRSLLPDDDEALYIEPSTNNGFRPMPAEERIGKRVRGCEARIY